MKNYSILLAVARLARLLAVGVLILSTSLVSVQGAIPAHGFNQTRVATGLVEPVYITPALTEGGMLIGEKGGRVRVLKNGAFLPTPFLTVPVDTAGDRGLFAIAFDNQVGPVQHVFVYYTALTPTIHNRVSRFTINQSNPDTVVSGSELVLLDLPTLTNTYNNGGALLFHEGDLYVSTGDDGIPANAQSLSNPFGKILRINKLGGIPDTNPFLSRTTGINRAIWSLGLRNPGPITYTYDGKFVTHDKGNAAIERNVIVSGANYGWPTCDGSCPNPAFTNPVSEYEIHPIEINCDVKAATAYYSGSFGTDCGYFPNYAASYFYTTCDEIRVIFANGREEVFVTDADRPSGLAVDSNGHLWYLERGSGAVYRVYLDTPCLTAPTITVQPQENQTVAAGTRYTLSVQATASPGCALNYRWYIMGSDGDMAPIAGATNPSYTFTAREWSAYRVNVSNVAGNETSRTAFVDVPLPPPFEAEILAVENSSGDPIRVINDISFSGGAARMVDSNATNDQVTFRLPNVKAGIYLVKVEFKQLPTSGKVQVMTGKIGGALSNVGAVLDLYVPQERYYELTVGTWTVQSTGDKQIRFKVTGKNASSSGFNMCIDSITLIPQ